MIEERINQDLKQALLAGDKLTVSTLRSLKSAILYLKVANGGPRDEPLVDKVLLALLQKEAKKRQESADLFNQGGGVERAQAELAEKIIIERYLPAQLDESTLTTLVEETIAELRTQGQAIMSTAIRKVKEKTAGSADSALIARLIKERLQQ